MPRHVSDVSAVCRERADGHGFGARLPLCLVLLALVVPAIAASQTRDEAREILERFAADYRSDPTFTESVTFGVRVDEWWWMIRARAGTSDTPAEVVVSEGRPTEPTFFFFLDGETLKRLDRGELNARTAMGRARHSDAVPMDIDPTDPSLVWDEAVSRKVNLVSNHFWVRGLPEFLALNKEASRIIHGANAVLLHYYEGLRSVWYQVEPGQHINRDPRDQTNPFPSLFIFLTGSGKARIGGIETDIRGGTATLIPAGMSHEFWNPFDEPFEFILVMFGEGA